MMISYPTTLAKDILFLNYYLIHINKHVVRKRKRILILSAFPDSLKSILFLTIIDNSFLRENVHLTQSLYIKFGVRCTNQNFLP